MNLSDLLNRHRALYATDVTRSVDFRVQQLQRLKSAIQLRQEDLHRAVFDDFGKSAFESHATELMLVLHDIEEAMRRLPRWCKPRRVRTNLLNWPGRSWVAPEPLGTCLVIGAWNYPYLLSLAPAVAALAGGNTLILKPSELPQATSRALSTLIGETFDADYFAVVEGGAQETTELLRHRFDKIFFTGSSAVGKIVYQAAASQLTPVTLELGGKSPVFITADCDLRVSARRLIWGKFLNAGQTCVAPDYAMVDARIEEDFLQMCRAEIQNEQLSVAHGNYTQIINTRHYDRLMRLISPLNLYHGGSGDPKTRTIEPTILRGVTFEDPVMQEEVFGPILPVLTYDRIEDALERVRSLPKPLSCYIFSNNKETQAKILSRISAGGVTINDVVLHIANPHLPFGGVGESGMGRYHGEAGFKTFSNEKSVLRKATWPDLELRYSPRTVGKLRWLDRLMRWPN